MIPYTLITIIVLIILGVILAIRTYKTRGEKHETDYRTLFIIGASWIPLGIALENHAFTIIGLVFIAVGITNKDKWKNVPTPPMTRTKLITLLLLGLAIFTGLLVFYFKMK